MAGVGKRVMGGWTLGAFTEAQSGQAFTIITGVSSYVNHSTAVRRWGFHPRKSGAANGLWFDRGATASTRTAFRPSPSMSSPNSGLPGSLN
jgi:hypothetical protein